MRRTHVQASRIVQAFSERLARSISGVHPPTMPKTALSRRLARAREQRKLSPGELAKDANVSQRHVYAIESGESTNPRLETLIRLADSLNVPLEWLSIGSGPEPDWEGGPAANMLAEVAKLKSAIEWQPIETAPKDGTRVLLGDDEGTVRLAVWETRGSIVTGWWSGNRCRPTGWTHWAPVTLPGDDK